MRVSYRWLKDYLPVKISAPDVVDILMMNGIEVEGEIDLGFISGNILAARIIEINPHPNAEKLRLATVELGREKTLQVVCGAPNIEVGQTVPLALEGAVLPNGLELKPTVIRGVESQGMLCSMAELGVAEDADGIWILPDEIKPGEPVDLLFEISITPNRPDCLSMIGLAREIAVHFKREVKPIHKRVNETLDRVDSFVRVTVKSPRQCPRYTCRVVKGVRIGESPDWLRYRLEAAGLRSINNVVDVTNFVLLEHGQPLHAFDLDRIFNHHIEVRQAEEGEQLQTIDDQTITLTSDDVVIADHARAIALGGIMGGKNSEVSPSVFNVLIESAYFDPQTIRRSSKRLDKSTDSSYRFERGVDPHGVVDALNRATELVQEVAGGNITKGNIDIKGHLPQTSPITIRVARCNKILGVDINARDIADVLVYLGFQLIRSDREKLTLKPPSHRTDIFREIDLIEEVGRIRGYHKIESVMPYMQAATEMISDAERVTIALKGIMEGEGFNEVINYSFISRDAISQLGLPVDKVVKLANPLTVDQEVMRTSLVPGIMRTVQRNQAHGILDVKVFEIGKTYEAREGDDEESVAKEHRWLTAAAIGNYQSDWHSGNTPVDYYTMKGVAEQCLANLGVDGVTVKPIEGLDYFHPHRAAAIMKGNAMICRFGEMHPLITEEIDLRGRLLLLEISLDTLTQFVNFNRKMQSIPRYPAVLRDLAVLVDADVASGEIAETIIEVGGELVEKATLFDVYEGDKVEKGKKSLAYSISYRAADRTLKDEEVKSVEAKILGALGERFSAALRG